MVSELNHIEWPAQFILADSPHKCGRKQFIEQLSLNCTRKTSPDQHFLEPPIGFEPMTFALQERCSTTELRRRNRQQVYRSAPARSSPKSSTVTATDSHRR
jgi:hypothetical protein